MSSVGTLQAAVKRYPGRVTEFSMEAMARRLKAARHEAGLSQKELAERSKVRVMTISSWESGRSQRPDLSAVERVAVQLNKSLQFLLFGDQVPTEEPTEEPLDDPILSEFLASPFGQDVTEDELHLLRTQVDFKGGGTVKAYYFALMAFREIE